MTRYRRTGSAVVWGDDGNEEQAMGSPNQQRASSSALSSASSCTIDGMPTPETSREGTPKRPLSPIDHSQRSQGNQNKRSRFVQPDSPVIHLDNDEAIYIDSDDDMDEAEVLEHGLDLQQHRQDREPRVRMQNQNPGQPRGRRVPLPVRNAPLQHPYTETPSYDFNGVPLRAGKTIELQDGTFLQLKAVIYNPFELNDDGIHDVNFVKLRGWQLKRSTDLEGLLYKKCNELAYVYEIDLDDPRPVQEQSVIEVSLAEVVKVRQLVRTNRPFPECRFSLDDIPAMGSQEELGQHIRKEERLVVRWKFTTVFQNAQKRFEFQKAQNYTRFKSRNVGYLTEAECTKGYGVSAASLREAWRGVTILGGSGIVQVAEDIPCPDPDCQQIFAHAESLFRHFQAIHGSRQAAPHRRAPASNQSATPLDVSWGDYKLDELFDAETITRAFDQVSDEQHESKEDKHASSVENVRRRMESEVSLDDEPSVTRKYTFGDGFCCGGGVSSAAKMAGLQPTWAFDNDPKTKPTYTANFPDVEHLLVPVHEFATADKHARIKSKEHFVDIGHVSPVCDYYSPNKTHRGCDADEDKEATLFCAPDVVEVARLRICTLEQTFGLIERFPLHFNTLIGDLTLKGYSVSWQVVKFQNYGAPQRRRRLIILAAGPGDTLPEMPPYTHSDNPFDGLKPLNSVTSALARIPCNAPNHDVRDCFGDKYLPWDGSGIIDCIVRSGNRAHPRGGRKLTDREWATLQTFPMNHQFIGNQTEVRKMIGNAVPPGMMKIIFDAVKRHLEDTDGVVHSV